jgi:spore coat polysaccharide biosynthesis protein SpsF
VVRAYRDANVDYVSNTLQCTYPDGMDTQVFATEVLADVASRTQDPVDHEHVSLYIYRHPEVYSLANVAAPPQEKRPELRLTLDTAEDLAVIHAIFEALRPGKPDFPLVDMLAFLDANPQIAALNADVQGRRV